MANPPVRILVLTEGIRVPAEGGTILQPVSQAVHSPSADTVMHPRRLNTDVNGPGPPPRLLPYPPREGQQDLVAAARMACLEGRHALLEAGTGTGKTVAVLAAALAAADQLDKTIIYLTRTNSQQRQAVIEARALTTGPEATFPRVAGKVPITIAVQGRAHLCPELRSDARYADAAPDEYARLCGALKRKSLDAYGLRTLADAWPGWEGRDAEGADTDDAMPPSDQDQAEVDSEAHTQAHTHSQAQAQAQARAKPRLQMAKEPQGCPYYDGLIESDPVALRELIAQHPRSADELAHVLEARGTCPYEAAKAMLHSARIIVAPYIYAADPSLRHALEEWLGKGLQDTLLVIDEAHNLPDYLKQLHSPRLSQEGLRRARSELDKIGDRELAPRIRATRFLQAMHDTIAELATEHLEADADDARLRPDALPESLLVRLGVSSRAIQAVIHELLAIGEEVRTREQQAGRLPRSHLGALAGFLAAWFRAEPDEHVGIVLRHSGDDNHALLLHCVDPAVGSRFLHDAHASLHLSATLRPMEQYRDLLGLPTDVITAEIPSPYPPERLRLVLVDDVTTQYGARQDDPAMMARLHDHVQGFLATEGINSAVFFPSHNLLQAFHEAGIDAAVPNDDTVRRRVYVEHQSQGQAALMTTIEAFRRDGEATRHGGPGACFLGVIGGRIAEGMDFPGSGLEAIALVGVPYPKPTARLQADIHYNDTRFGRGWDYAVHAPMVRRVLQTIGRIIRDADDQGVVYLLDERYRRIAAHLPRLERLGDEENVAVHLAQWIAARDAARVGAAPATTATASPLAQGANEDLEADVGFRTAAEVQGTPELGEAGQADADPSRAAPRPAKA